MSMGGVGKLSAQRVKQVHLSIMAEYGRYDTPRHAQTWPQMPPAPNFVEMPDVEYQYDNGSALGLYRDLGDLENDECVEFRQPADYEYMDQKPHPGRFYPPPPPPLYSGYTHTPFNSDTVPYTSSPPPLTRCDSAPASPRTPQTPYYGFPPSAEPLAELGDNRSCDSASPQQTRPHTPQSTQTSYHGFPPSAELPADHSYPRSCDPASPQRTQFPQTPYYGFPPSAEPLAELGSNSSCDPATPRTPWIPYEYNYGFPFSAEPLAEHGYTPTHSPTSTPDLAELPSDAPPESYLSVRLLYRSITGESRTMSRAATGIAPATLLFQHWAVEVGPLSSGHRFELEYVGLSKLRYTTPSSTRSFVSDRSNYHHAPKGFRGMSSGFTRMGVEEIRAIAEQLMEERYLEYKLGSTDCRNFALELMGMICRGNTGVRARALMGVDKVMRKGVDPVGKVGTRGLRKLGLLGDGGCW